MAHKYEHVSTGGGFSVLNGATKTQVIAQDGTLVGDAALDDASVSNAKLEAPKLAVYQETITLADFTDGEGASGTVSLGVSIPKGAFFVKTLISDIVGFEGDTSAVITIGDGTDVDRYNTGTPSVFATADTVDAGVVSGTAYHSAAKTPVVTVTGASDFTAITAGSITITLFYYVD